MTSKSKSKATRSTKSVVKQKSDCLAFTPLSSLRTDSASKKRRKLTKSQKSRKRVKNGVCEVKKLAHGSVQTDLILTRVNITDGVVNTEDLHLVHLRNPNANEHVIRLHFDKIKSYQKWVTEYTGRDLYLLDSIRHCATQNDLTDYFGIYQGSKLRELDEKVVAHLNHINLDIAVGRRGQFRINPRRLAALSGTMKSALVNLPAGVVNVNAPRKVLNIILRLEGFRDMSIVLLDIINKIENSCLDTLNIDENNLETYLRLSHILEIEFLRGMVARFVEQNLSRISALKAFETAQRWNALDISKMTINVVTRDLRSYVRSPQWITAEPKTIQYIVNLPSESNPDTVFDMADEEELALAILTWLEAHPSMRMGHAVELLCKIRFHKIKGDSMWKIYNSVKAHVSKDLDKLCAYCCACDRFQTRIITGTFNGQIPDEILPPRRFLDCTETKNSVSYPIAKAKNVSLNKKKQDNKENGKEDPPSLSKENREDEAESIVDKIVNFFGSDD